MSFRLSTGLRDAMLAGIGFKGAFDGGKIDIFSGSIPADADTDEGAGTKLITITVGAGAFPGAGVTFDAPSGGSISGAAAETWQGVGLANGVSSWFRMYGPTVVTGDSTTAIRLDGTIGTSNADMIVSSVNVVLSATSTIGSSTFTLPATI